MGSESIASLILLIASLIIAGAVSGVMIGGFTKLSNEIQDKADNSIEKIGTDIKVINDPDTNGTYNTSTNTLTLYVKNVGTESLKNSTEIIDVFIDGKFTGVDSMTVHESKRWREGNVAELKININLSSGYHRAKVVVQGDAEVLEFYV